MESPIDEGARDPGTGEAKPRWTSTRLAYAEIESRAAAILVRSIEHPREEKLGHGPHFECGAGRDSTPRGTARLWISRPFTLSGDMDSIDPALVSFTHGPVYRPLNRASLDANPVDQRANRSTSGQAPQPRPIQRF